MVIKCKAGGKFPSGPSSYFDHTIFFYISHKASWRQNHKTCFSATFFRLNDSLLANIKKTILSVIIIITIIIIIIVLALANNYILKIT